MLRFVVEHHISMKTNTYNGLREIHRLVKDAHSGTMQGKGVIIVYGSLR